ncbi:Ykud domain-containing protein [Clostridium sartagoforme AAU1]|uniref:Ykud domain-containing protein n=1 Tax=Clostridium sartagoforme AAU1 TaxID=1202534 RepID=R9C859_9CLOT|nr:hypothetical protein [Clostridium sartagoforme]EOR25564.1 Ykud domain-containing protein [Clostridium sartagoforme AAU1]
MKNINIQDFLKNKIIGYSIITAASITFIYLLISIFFINHLFFNTTINGIDVSLKTYEEAQDTLKESINEYKLKIVQRDEKIEELLAQDIELKFNENNSVLNIKKIQASLKWGRSLFKKQDYYINDLVSYDNNKLLKKIQELDCLK